MLVEEAAELANNLPLSFKTESEQKYIQFLWEAFESNYENKKYQFAYINIWHGPAPCAQVGIATGMLDGRATH